MSLHVLFTKTQEPINNQSVFSSHLLGPEASSNQGSPEGGDGVDVVATGPGDAASGEVPDSYPPIVATHR